MMTQVHSALKNVNHQNSLFDIILNLNMLKVSTEKDGLDLMMDENNEANFGGPVEGASPSIY